jgi:hypothetical protein
MNEIERQPKIETGSEIMKLPEISIKEEKGEVLLSILFKGYDSSWGGHQHELVGEVEKFFEKNPLSEESLGFLREIKALEEGGIDEEVLYEIALTLNDSERVLAVVDFIEKYKYPVQDFQGLRERLIIVLTELELSLPADLKGHIQQVTTRDIIRRKENLEMTKKQIADLIDFFRPSPKTTKIRQVAILPTDFLYHEQSGTAFEFGDMTILRSHIDNPSNLEHEFLHSVINPIVEKLGEQLTEEKKEKISQLSSHRLKVEEGYGNGYESLLCEELIRTYNDVIQKGEQLLSYENFCRKIDSLNENQFQEIMQNGENFKNRCGQLGIASLSDLKERRREYYTRFGEGELRQVVYAFYQKYIQAKETNKRINFEEFVLNEFSKEL